MDVIFGKRFFGYALERKNDLFVGSGIVDDDFAGTETNPLWLKVDIEALTLTLPNHQFFGDHFFTLLESEVGVLVFGNGNFYLPVFGG